MKVKVLSHVQLLWPHELYCPWYSPGQNTGVGSHSLLQGIFPTQVSNPGLPHCRRISYQLSYLWVKENGCFSLLGILDGKEIKPVNLKEINPEYSLERLMLKPKLQYLAHLMWRADSDVWKDWRQKEKRAAEDEIVRYHHWLNGHEFPQTLGDSGGQRSLMCYSSWGHKELDTT